MKIEGRNRQGNFTLRLAQWGTDAALLQEVRRKVFVEEQNIPEVLEWDEHDPAAQHLLALDLDGRAIGTARLLVDGHIGRIAVLKQWRSQGVGNELLNYLIILNKKQGRREALLRAQVRVMPFYARHGFVAEGDEYLDAGIPHRLMRLVY
ncbi:MAG: GNAT family N-acetyltransferase [Burkholderiales bacterium]